VRRPLGFVPPICQRDDALSWSVCRRLYLPLPATGARMNFPWALTTAILPPSLSSPRLPLLGRVTHVPFSTGTPERRGKEFFSLMTRCIFIRTKSRSRGMRWRGARKLQIDARNNIATKSNPDPQVANPQLANAGAFLLFQKTRFSTFKKLRSTRP